MTVLRLPLARRTRALHERGVTLIELVVVAAVIAILSMAALPSYRSQVLRTNRIEARSALLALAMAQERFHLACHRYAARLDPEQEPDCDDTRLDFPTRSERGLYSVRITSADAGSWAAESLPTGEPQTSDHACQSFVLESTGRRRARNAAGDENALECWGR
jgi:type IV pilus assembly protein PilE